MIVGICVILNGIITYHSMNIPTIGSSRGQRWPGEDLGGSVEHLLNPWRNHHVPHEKTTIYIYCIYIYMLYILYV